ncbi:MAG: hypothetical protein JWR67_1577 [Mucilaginibacter sp.]|nr:hypothetical protein [Mucilaginibacter sp.]
MPTAAPALNMPLITEHPLIAITARTNNNTFNFFIGLIEFILFKTNKN